MESMFKINVQIFIHSHSLLTFGPKNEEIYLNAQSTVHHSLKFYCRILFAGPLIGAFLIESLNNSSGRTNYISVMHYANASLSFLSLLISMKSRQHFMMKRAKENLNILKIFRIIVFFIIKNDHVPFTLQILGSFTYIYIHI